MTVPLRHVLHQGRVLGALARSALAVARGTQTTAAPQMPGPWLRGTMPPLPDALIKDYVRHVGGDPGTYRRTVPPHLFPQWVFPLQAKALEGVPYPMQKVLNGGCRVEVKGDLPRGEPLAVATRLDHVDDDGRRAVLRFLATTGTRDEPDLLETYLYAIVPLGKKGSGAKKTAGPKKKKVRARVPTDAREIARWRLPANAGLDFAKLTGDFNPVHWVPPYARAFGFRNVILHGFSTLARAWEGLRSRRWRPRVMDVQFTKPLILPARVGLFVRDSDVFVGDAAGGPAYLKGTYER